MIQHVVIFDGPDGCGKTNMALELSQKINVPYFKNKREAKFFEDDPGYFVKALKYADPYFASYLHETKASVILDRSFPSEFVYSKVLGRDTSMDMLRLVDSMYASLNTKIIIPYRTSYNKVIDQFSSIDENVLIEVDKVYKEFMRWTSCEVLHMNVDDESLEREMSQIIAFIHDVKQEHLGGE